MSTGPDAKPEDPLPTDAPSTDADAQRGVPGYTVLRVLAQTAFAHTFAAQAAADGTRAVIKRLTPAAAEDATHTQRIQRDNRVVAGLRPSPQLARVLDVGEGPAAPWVVMEHIEGVPLHRRLAEHGPMPIAPALVAVRDAARALEKLWAAGVVHRNIQPSSLFLQDDGSVKVADVGFAPPLAFLGGPSGLFGAAAFLAPEVVRGGAPDMRSDAYALGATLFMLTTGRPLFEGTIPDVLTAHQKKPVPSIATLVPDAGIVVVDVLYRLLQKDPARRPSPVDLLTLLEEGVERTTRARTSSSAAGADLLPVAGVAAGGAGVLPRRGSGSLPVPRVLPTELKPPSPVDAVPSIDDNPYAAQPTGVLGTLKQMSVAEIAQMLEIGKKSARVEVHTLDNLKGTLHVHDGQIVHASAGPDVGEAAVVALVRRKEGTFRIHYDKEPCARNIERPTTFVLLDAMRQIDEGPPDAGAPVPPAVAALPSRGPSPGGDPTWVTQVLSGGTDEDLSLEEVSDIVSLSSGEGEGITSGAHRPSPTNPGTWRVRASAIVDEVVLRAQAWRPLLAARAAALRTHGRAWTARVERGLAPLGPPLARLHPALGAARPIVVVGAACGVMAVLVGALISWLFGHDRDPTTRVLAGEAAAVVEELEHKGLARRTLEEDLALAHAYGALGNEMAALELYAVAIPAGVADPLALAYLLSRLDASAPNGELDLLVLWPDDTVEDSLELYALDPRRYVRANAVAALVERGALARIHVEETAILDVQQGGCGARRFAAEVLRAVGRTEGALDAVGRVPDAPGRCLSSAEAREVQSAIARRM